MKNNTQNIRSLIKKDVLDKGYLMSLATHDDGGVWCCDVIYVHDDDFNIYWMSDPEVRHSEAIHKNNRVAGTITISGPKEDNLGVQFEGQAERLKGARLGLAVKHLRKRRKIVPKKVVDILDGDSWYVLRPKKIELTHEEFFGFDKQILEL